jgi:hypothetical protein
MLGEERVAHDRATFTAGAGQDVLLVPTVANRAAPYMTPNFALVPVIVCPCFSG